MRSASKPRPDAGISALEFVGVAMVAASVIGVVSYVVAPDYVREVASTAVCRILSQDGCGDIGGPGSAPDGKTMCERATAGSAWFGGDSYASGEGLPTYEEGTDVPGVNWKNPITWWPTNWGKERNMCHRSGTSYQAQTFETLQGKGAFEGQQYSSGACSGSTVPNIYDKNEQGNAGEGPQMYQEPTTADEENPFDNIPEDVSLISLSMGGNDVGFGDVLTNCVTGIFGSGCGDTERLKGEIDKVYGTGKADQVGTLEYQLRKLKDEHPDARIIVMGYPELFAETSPFLLDENGDIVITPPGPSGLGGGPVLTWNGSGMSIEDQKWANDLAGEINQSGQAMADRLGIEWVDPTDVFVGPGYDHRIGSEDPWINGLSAGDHSGDWTVNKGSFHPNQGGHDAMAGLLLERVGC